MVMVSPSKSAIVRLMPSTATEPFKTIQAAVDNWALPADTDYTLVNATTGRALAPGEALATAVRPGDVLEVQPVLVAG